MLIGEHAPFDHFSASAHAAEIFEPRASPARALPRNRVSQRAIHGERIVIDQRRRLVQDFMIHGVARLLLSTETGRKGDDPSYDY